MKKKDICATEKKVLYGKIQKIIRQKKRGD